MDFTIFIFLTSGLFLGWSLGANDAANVFGTAVGSRMIRFTTAAIISSIFIILGAVLSGAGAAHGLGKLGALNALPGAFMTALAAAVTVYWMTRLSLPVSTTQAIVGAIVGWNWYSGSITNMAELSKIVGTWIAAPILGAVFSAITYKITTWVIKKAQIHLIRLDAYTRVGLVVAGAFGAYSLGANNIGNVMGVFVSSSPFTDIQIKDLATFTSVQQLFLLGAVAIAVGVFTYSKKVMMTVGDSLMPLTPVAAWVVVIAQSIVLFLFASVSLEHFLISHGLPSIPLIPVSSSQAVVGAVIGIGLVYGKKGAKQIRWRVLGNIASGWVSTPIISATICFVMLFFLQNVFNQQVYKEVYFQLDKPVLEYLERQGIETEPLADLEGKKIAKAVAFRDLVRERYGYTPEQQRTIVSAAQIYPMRIEPDKVRKLDHSYLSESQIEAVAQLMGKEYRYKWQLAEDLAALAPAWKEKPKTKL
ncbi:MAG TPA: inorganic phosphate transporter, partial [Sedimenticola sp.]|nr:inorganic phosphate transporter [Sedimenticola sp.]